MQINNHEQKGTAETAVMHGMTISLNEKPYFRSLLIRSSVGTRMPLLSKQKTSSYQEANSHFVLDFPDTEFSFIYNCVSDLQESMPVSSF